MVTGQNGGWERLRGDLARVQPPLDTSATLPPACYTDDDVFEHERGAVFRKSWVSAGRADRWKAPGDFTALTLAGVPLIVIRDARGALRAYANSCRHRGTQLLTGDGNCPRRIRCPFHSWTYGLDGRLIAAPQMEHAATFDRADYGLVAFRVAVRDGFAFICFDDDAPEIDDWLGDFSDVHAPWALGDMVSTRRREFDIACNWKAFLEVFNEYYHLGDVHPDSIGNVYDLPDDPDAVSGHYATQFGTTQGTGGLLETAQNQTLPTNPSLDGRNRQGTRYSWVFPNLTFAAGTEAVWIYETYPIAPNRTRVGMTVCFPAEIAALPDFEDRARHYYERMDTLLSEDIPMLERQHAGLASPFAKQGRFSYLEPNVASFAAWYARALME